MSIRFNTQAFLFSILFVVTWCGTASAQFLACRAPQPPYPDLLCGTSAPYGAACLCQNIGGGGPNAYGPGKVVSTNLQFPPSSQMYSYVGQQAQQIGRQCAAQAGGSMNVFVACAQQQVVLPFNQQVLIDCAARSGGSWQGFGICVGNGFLPVQLNEEQQIAAQCVAETNGQPYAAAACTASRLTARELGKCLNGIGGPNGCFGDNNDLVGGNGWTVRSFNNVVSDIQRGPGPTNDLVGPDGFLIRSWQNMRNDIQNGPGPNNEVVGCNGWVNTQILGGHC
jgi:hypothetical protein